MTRAFVVIISVLALTIGCGDNDGDDGGDDDVVDAADSDGTSGDPDGTSGDIDAPPGTGPDASVGTMCGTMTCTTSQECCVQGQGRTCVDMGSCQGVNFDCDGAEDCDPGEVCCYGGGGGNGGTSCTTAANCPAPTCTQMSDCPNANQECCMIGQVQVCANQCPGP